MDESLFPFDDATALESIHEEEKMIRNIQIRVEELLSSDPGLLFSHLYRLDVDESSLQSILNNTAPNDLSMAIAMEIWKRQKQRFQTKKDFGNRPIPEGWEW